ncbi:MAG: GNAT family N-acetyltransferase [Acidimicrobiia bacterium]|nr:GNAT family N-acetyltransferase [Acidimicrobiia bacterium]
MNASRLRPVEARDLDQLLEINNASIPAVNALRRDDLAWFAERASWFTVAEHHDAIAGYLIGLHGPLEYDSPNWRTFSTRFGTDFVYVDRVVVDPSMRRAGVGRLLYQAFADHGRALGVRRVCAEVNVRPHNGPSLRFHRRFGYRPVGEQDTDGGTKRVQLLSLDLADPAPPMDRQRIVEVAAAHDPDIADRLEFILDLDRLKTVVRASLLVDGTRRENTAEHSWHLAMIAMTLAPLATEPIDLARVITILLVHDIVEIDAGDTYIYDEAGAASKLEREQAAADRIFGLLPNGEGAALRELWDEYEQRVTPEGRFAYACDRLQPLLLNLASGSSSWQRHDITVDRVRAVNSPIADASPELWQIAKALLDEAVATGTLAPPAD